MNGLTEDESWLVELFKREVKRRDKESNQVQAQHWLQIVDMVFHCPLLGEEFEMYARERFYQTFDVKKLQTYYSENEGDSNSSGRKIAKKGTRI